ARLLFPVALCFTFTSSSSAGDAVPSYRPAFSDSWLDSSAISFRRRRKKLEAPSDCGCYCAADRDHSWHVYSHGPVHALESAHERLERRASTRPVHPWHDRTRAAGGARVSGQAGPQLPLSWCTA